MFCFPQMAKVDGGNELGVRDALKKFFYSISVKEFLGIKVFIGAILHLVHFVGATTKKTHAKVVKKVVLVLHRQIIFYMYRQGIWWKIIIYHHMKMLR